MKGGFARGGWVRAEQEAWAYMEQKSMGVDACRFETKGRQAGRVQCRVCFGVAGAASDPISCREVRLCLSSGPSHGGFLRAVIGRCSARVLNSKGSPTRLLEQCPNPHRRPSLPFRHPPAGEDLPNLPHQTKPHLVFDTSDPPRCLQPVDRRSSLTPPVR